MRGHFFIDNHQEQAPTFFERSAHALGVLVQIGQVEIALMDVGVFGAGRHRGHEGEVAATSAHRLGSASMRQPIP